MSRFTVLLLLLALGARAEEPQAERRRLRVRLHPGDRVTAETSVSFTMKTVVRHGRKTTTSSETVQRTERFLETVLRAGENGTSELERTYETCFTKRRTSDDEAPTIEQSPVKGRTVLIREMRRRREAEVDGRPIEDGFLRRVIGVEMDWRDILSDDPVAPGDAWDGDATALARRLAAYLDSGTRSKMRVRYEENAVREGREVAKLYVDWTVEGMRDRRLYTKVNLAGDVFFDFALERVVHVDLAGTMIVRGAVVNEGPPTIVNGDATVVLASTITPEPAPEPVEAAAPGE